MSTRDDFRGLIVQVLSLTLREVILKLCFVILCALITMHVRDITKLTPRADRTQKYSYLS